MAGRSWVGMAKPSLETRLVEAVRSGDASSVNILLNKGANVNAVVASGDTAIGVAAQNGDVTILRLLLDFNSYSSQRTAEKSTRHSDSTCVYGRSTKGNDYCKRTCHSDSVIGYDDSDTNNCGTSQNMDKNRCHSDATYVYDRSSTRSLHVETACDPTTIANTNRVQRTSHIDAQCVNCDSTIFKTNKDKNMFYSDAGCLYKGNDFNNKRTDHSDVACNGSSSTAVKIADKTRCHSDAVDNVRTTSSSDKNNCGYFVVYHEDACEQDENENCNLEGRTPEGMDQLEWDVEVRVGEEEVEEKDADVWSCQYRWYADILDKTRCEEELYDPVDVQAAESCQVNLQDVHGCTALHYAASQGHLEAVRLLIEAGCQVEICDTASQTALHLAAAHGNTAVVEELVDACRGTRRQQHLVNLETGDSRRMTALHFASGRGQWRTCVALLSRGAHVNALDAQDRTPLYLAVARQHVTTARLLLRHGANANIEQIRGLTAMCEAVWSGNVSLVATLAAADARLCPAHQLLHHAVLHRNAAMVAQLLPLQPHVNAAAQDGGDTPLMLAARTRQLQVARLLLMHGAKANAVNAMSGCTPLMAAVESLIDCPSYESEATPTAQMTSSFEAIVRLLVDYGADLNHCPAVGYYTPLTKLMVLKKFSKAAFLIRIGADVNKCSRMGDYVFDNLRLATTCKQLALVQLIVYAGYRMTRDKLDQLTAVGDQLTSKQAAIDYSWLHYSCTNVWPLTHLCRLVVRTQLLVTSVDSQLDALPIPNLLKRFIRMEELQVEDDDLSSNSATTSSLFF